MSTPVEAMERRTIVAVAAVSVLLGFFALNDIPIGVFQDDGHYLVLARAIAEGAGYRYTNLPGAPAATHFPPGYPLLLAPLWWLAPRFPANVMLFKLVNVVLLPVAALGVRAMARRVGGLGVVAAAGIAIASVASVPLLFLTGLVFSEIAFIAALCGVLIIAESLVRRSDAISLRAALAVGTAIGALTMLRTIGVTLLPTLLTVLCWRRRWRDATLVMTGALVFLLPWQWWTTVHAHDVPSAVAGAYGAYGPWLVEAWRTGGTSFARAVVVENLRGLRMPLMLFGLYEVAPWLQAVAALALLGFAAVGARRLWSRAPVTVLFFVPYGLLLLAWPFPPDRFLWPLWPVVLVLLVRGVTALGGADAQPSVRRPARVATALLTVCFITWHVRNWSERSWEELARTNARVGLAAAGVALALPRDGLVATDQDAMVHLYAGRPAVPLVALTAEQHVRTRSDDEVAAQVEGVLDAYHPRWVLVVQRESLRAARLIATRGRLKLTGADPSGVLVYDVVR